MNLNQSKFVCFFVVVIVTCVGGAIRFVIAHQDLLWLDELHTVWVTSDSFADVLPRARQGNQSPFFFWFVWAVVQQLGTTILTVRLVSLVSGLLVLLVASFLAWKWTRSVLASLLVGWLIAIDPQFVFYGTEARPYVLLQLLSIVHVLLYWNLLSKFYVEEANLDEKRKGRWLGIGITTTLVSAAMFYCHYTCSWLFVAEIVFFVFYCSFVKFSSGKVFQAGRAMVSFLVIAVAVALICIPGIIHLLEVFERRDNWSPVSSGPVLLNSIRWSFLLNIVLPIFCAAAFYFPNREGLDARLFDLPPTERNLSKMPFVLLWAAVPVASVLLLDHYQVAPLALNRYTVVGAVAFPLFAGLCVGISGKWYGQLAIATILVAVSFFDRYEGGQLFANPFTSQLMTTQTLPLLRFEDWRSPIMEINAREDKSTHPVFLFANVIEDVHAFATDDQDFHSYLLFPLNGLEPVDVSNRQAIAAPTLLHQHFRPTDIELIKQQGGAWLIIRGDQPLVMAISDELRRLIKHLEEGKEGRDPDDENGQKPDGPEINFAQFPASNVYLVSIDW